MSRSHFFYLIFNFENNHNLNSQEANTQNLFLVSTFTKDSKSTNTLLIFQRAPLFFRADFLTRKAITQKH